MLPIHNKIWHHLPIEEVLEALDTKQEKGLDTYEIEERLKHYGLNQLKEFKGKSPFVRFMLQFHQPLIYILLAACVVTVLFREYVDASVIFAVVLVNAIMGYVQEAKALTAISALSKSLSSQAVVLRSGRKVEIPSTELVPGDIVFLQSGDKVPADLRLIRVRDLQVDESALTGESVPVQKAAGDLSHDTPLADRKNMAYSSTLVTYGTATGVAIATADNTEIGMISELISTTEVLATPLTRKMQRFSHILMVVILALTVITIGVGLMHGQPLLDTIMAAIALTVGSIPEGLPAAVTVILAIGVARMAKRRAIIRSLPAVETLGSTTIICSDKTGTLTQNQMTVTEMIVGGEHFHFSGVGYAPEGEITGAEGTENPAGRPGAIACLRAGMLCNDSALLFEEDVWKIQGDPTEGALLVSAAKAGMEREQLQKDYPRLDTIPFESEHQYMATLHAVAEESRRVVFLKGSAEKILLVCDKAMLDSGESADLDRDAIQKDLEDMAGRGLRVLAFASKEVPESLDAIHHSDTGSGFTFLGLQASIDPPRPEVADAIDTCQRAGVHVKMITGDHVITARSIAEQIGIKSQNAGNPGLKALTGRELEDLSDSELERAVSEVNVFARVNPEHKLRLVKAMQARGNIVAMTGDGVNDAPALRRADIGVAMAKTGTEVAREAADMVLTDDNFASIEAAVEEGRGVFDNLTKYIVWSLPTNGGEGLVVLLAIFLGIPLPISPVQILWINMTTAGFLGMMLAFEPKEPGIMNRQPRNPNSPIISMAHWVRILFVSLLLCAGAFTSYRYEMWRGESLEVARTAATAVFFFGALVYVFNCRSLTRSMFSLGLFTNPWVWAGAGGMTVMQLSFTYIPFMNRMFGSAPLNFSTWGGILLFSLALFGIVELEKKISAWISGR